MSKAPRHKTWHQFWKRCCRQERFCKTLSWILLFAIILPLCATTAVFAAEQTGGSIQYQTQTENPDPSESDSTDTSVKTEAPENTESPSTPEGSEAPTESGTQTESESGSESTEESGTTETSETTTTTTEEESTEETGTTDETETSEETESTEETETTEEEESTDSSESGEPSNAEVKWVLSWRWADGDAKPEVQEDGSYTLGIPNTDEENPVTGEILLSLLPEAVYARLENPDEDSS